MGRSPNDEVTVGNDRTTEDDPRSGSDEFDDARGRSSLDTFIENVTSLARIPMRGHPWLPGGRGHRATTRDGDGDGGQPNTPPATPR